MRNDLKYHEANCIFIDRLCPRLQLWRNGPDWLDDPSKWPPIIILEPSPESSAEVKVVRSVFTTATTRVVDELDYEE